MVAGVLVTLGTLLAVSTWTAVLGMLAVGLLVAYAGVGGPRVAGVVNGLQLFHVLPCFPPYAPDALDQRLLGVGLGITLLAPAGRVRRCWNCTGTGSGGPIPAPVTRPVRRPAASGAACHAVRGGCSGGRPPRRRQSRSSARASATTRNHSE